MCSGNMSQFWIVLNILVSPVIPLTYALKVTSQFIKINGYFIRTFNIQKLKIEHVSRFLCSAYQGSGALKNLVTQINLYKTYGLLKQEIPYKIDFSCVRSTRFL